MQSETFERATGFDDTAHQHPSTIRCCPHLDLCTCDRPGSCGVDHLMSVAVESERFTWWLSTLLWQTYDAMATAQMLRCSIILDHQVATVAAAAAQQQQLTQAIGHQQPKRSKCKGQHNCSYRSDGTVFQQVAQQRQSAGSRSGTHTENQQLNMRGFNNIETV